MFPIGVGLGPIREGTDGAGLVGAAGACLWGIDTVCARGVLDGTAFHIDDGLQ